MDDIESKHGEATGALLTLRINLITVVILNDDG